ncbi:hypothetical protein C5Y96_17090 [Blastopirellula marina]|uniref:Uncharacterized protein n=1 Tax=Blastopirellula marina TaxID=124 RepID=A0A2S8F7F6_9BACT|nr:MULTISPECIES: hypothetical protein [Pirellulaceae]PQO28087.1 hypothetical protein C5Y96_17090 [Blastopirellula marina]RCS48513.1 hypothetical protein DTL36_17115 [Bremerella cremea]
MKKPNEINIGGVVYKITYTKDRVKTDLDKRSQLWGQICYHTRTIRVFEGENDHTRQPIDQFHVLLHEVIHGIIRQHEFLEHCIKDRDSEEVIVDQIASVLSDTLVRNGWFNLDDWDGTPKKARGK